MPSNTKIINIKLNLGTEEKPVIGDGGKKQFLKYNIKNCFFPPSPITGFPYLNLIDYSTVTDFAKFLGLSTSSPFSFEM